MMKTDKRDSIISWNTPASSRFSVSTQGSGNGRISMLSTRTSIYSGTSPTTPTGDSIPFPRDRAGSSRASVISKLSDTDETVEESDGPSPKVSISLEDGREFDLDTTEGSDTLVSANSFQSPDAGLLPPVKFPSESLSESIGDGFDVDEGSGPMTFSTALKRMSMITELRSKKDLSDAVSLLTVDEITAEVENKQHGSDEEEEEEEAEEEDEGEDEEDEEDGGEVELELHDADEPGKPITSHAGLLFPSHLFLDSLALSVHRENNQMDKGCAYRRWIVRSSVSWDGGCHWSFNGCQAGVATDGIWSKSGTETSSAKRARAGNRAFA